MESKSSRSLLGVAKEYPTNYPQDAVAILDAMSFTDGRDVKILGSMSLRSQQYAGDYDAFEVVRLPKTSDKAALRKLANKFKVIIKRLQGMKDVYIGDCKAGSIEEWRILPKTAEVIHGKVRGYNAVSCRRKVRELVDQGIISRSEGDDAMELLKSPIKPVDLIVAKSKLKFHLVRWTPPEILRGHKKLRDGRTFTLEEAFSSPTIAKLDVIGLVQRNRYTDFSMIYEFHNGKRVLNPDKIDIATSLRENILYYEHANNPFKVLKRRFALAKYLGDDKTITKLTPILNSDLGRIYHIQGDIGTLLSLLDDHKGLDLEKIRYEVDQFKNRMANIYSLPSFLKAEHGLLGIINSALRAPTKELLHAKLSKIEEALGKQLADNTRKMLTLHR